MSPETDYDELRTERPGRPQKVIDLKLPLTWLLATAFAVVTTSAAMYFKLERLVTDVNDLQATMRAGNLQSSATAGEIALLKYRVESLEAERRRAAEIQRNGK